MSNLQVEELKPLLKLALHELLIQEHSWILDLFYEAMEEVAMAKAIAEVKDSENLACVAKPRTPNYSLYNAYFLGGKGVCLDMVRTYAKSKRGVKMKKD